jgi:hypothetical protein
MSGSTVIQLSRCAVQSALTGAVGSTSNSVALIKQRSWSDMY